MADNTIWTFDSKKAVANGYELTFTDRLIKFRSSDLHTENQFSPRYGGVSWSATMRDGFNGCRFRHIGYSHPQYWKKIIVPMTDHEEDVAYAKATALLGKKYDLLGLLSFATPFEVIVPHRDRYWCSEAVAELYKAAKGWDIEPDKHTPETFYNWLIDEGYEVIL